MLFNFVIYFSIDDDDDDEEDKGCRTVSVYITCRRWIVVSKSVFRLMEKVVKDFYFIFSFGSLNSLDMQNRIPTLLKYKININTKCHK